MVFKKIVSKTNNIKTKADKEANLQNDGREEYMVEEAIQRISKMEQYFDILQDVTQTNPNAFKMDESVKEMFRVLVQYYEGGQWLRDYELDEKGLIPQNLKRGVLSEDAVYDFLEQVSNMEEGE